MLIPNHTIALAISQAKESHKPVSIYHYNKTFVILPQGYSIEEDIERKAIKVAEIDALGEYRDCTQREQQS